MRRPATVLALGLIAGVALTGCRTSPNVAAYVGDETITVDALQEAVDAHRADPAVTTGDEPDFSRTILSQLVRSDVIDSAAEHFGVDPDPAGQDDLLAALLTGQDPDAAFEQAGSQGLSRADVLERVRQIAVLQSIAVSEGAVEEPTDASLQAAYEEGLAQQSAQLDLGFINVPDQPTADAVVAQLQADPGSYAAAAAPYLDAQATLPAPQSVAVADLTGQLPPGLAAQVAQTPPGTVFSTPVEGLTGVLVVVVEETAVPTFEEARPQLEAAALNEAVPAGEAILADYEDSLDIDVNPRYGALQDGQVVAPDGGVVQLLGAGG
jgi:peptidyl-prolyl cis-trans isomerase SurA